MIIRVTTQEELREVLAYMCIYLGQTQVRIDLDDSTAPLHTSYLRVKVADGDFPVTVVCNKVAGIHITSDVTNVCISSYEDWLDVQP